MVKVVFGLHYQKTGLNGRFMKRMLWFLFYGLIPLSSGVFAFAPSGQSCMDIPPEISSKLVDRVPASESKESKEYPQGGIIQGSLAMPMTRGLRPIHQSRPQRAPVIKGLVDAVDLKGNLIGTGWTDEWGEYLLNLPLNVPGILGADLKSEHFRVRTYKAGSGTMRDPECQGIFCPEIYREEVFGTLRRPSMTLKFNLADQRDSEGRLTEYSVATANAYEHIRESIEWIHEISPHWVPPPPNLIATTNMDVGIYCNAFAGANEIIFLIGNGICANSSYSTIIRHEFGHVFVMTLGLNQEEVEDYFGFHEGVADTFSILSLDTFCSGLDLMGDGTGCVRSYHNLPIEGYTWPIESSSPHERGMVVGATFWELRENLAKEYRSPERGRKMAHKLFISSMFLNRTGLTPEIGRNVLRADEIFFQGRHRDLIRSTFQRRKLI